MVSAGILCTLLGKTSDPELRNSIKAKCFEYRERTELLRSIHERVKERSEVRRISVVLHGPEVGLKALEIIRSAASELLIMSYLIFDVKTIRGRDRVYRIDLLDALIQRSESGVGVRTVTSLPDPQILGNNALSQGDSIKRLLNESNVQVKLCNFAHSKFIVADGMVVWRGSANLTAMGLSGKGDIAEVTDDEHIVEHYYALFEERWLNTDRSCFGCVEKSCLKEYTPPVNNNL
ncbi:MAG: phospholipase D family protein [Candidatus Freyrarchaeum guaymaensis]